MDEDWIPFWKGLSKLWKKLLEESDEVLGLVGLGGRREGGEDGRSYRLELLEMIGKAEKKCNEVLEDTFDDISETEIVRLTITGVEVDYTDDEDEDEDEDEEEEEVVEMD